MVELAMERHRARKSQRDGLLPQSGKILTIPNYFKVGTRKVLSDPRHAIDEQAGSFGALLAGHADQAGRRRGRTRSDSSTGIDVRGRKAG